MRLFLICAYPRSRTAWLANLLTWGNSFCFHEGLEGCHSSAELVAKLETAGAPVVGNSDPANVLALDRLMSLRPDMRLVFVERPLAEVAQSMEAIGLDSRNLSALADAWHRGIRDFVGMRVEFSDLAHMETCKRIADYVGADFSELRWRQLDRLNVSIDVRKSIESVHENRAAMRALIQEISSPVV